MAVDRREFVIRSSLALAGGALWSSLPARASGSAPGLVLLRDSVGLFSGQGGTIGWLLSGEALVVVDSQFPASAGDCLRDLRERSQRKLDALINTHHHGDHTSGNGVFRPEAKLIVAHRNVPGLQKQAAERRGTLEEQTYADTTFDTSWKLDAGGETVTATHYGAAHTGGDCVVHFQQANVAHMGDLVFNRFHPYIDRPAGASIQGWIGVLEKVMAEHDDETLYVFGHGNPEYGVRGGAADLAVMRDYLTALLDFTRKAMGQGKGVEELAGRETLPGFDSFRAPSDRINLEANLRVAFEELEAN